MNFVYRAKVVGLHFNKVQNAVEPGDYLILVANPENPVDPDCIEVYNAEMELVGYIANSERTLSLNNRKNGNISSTELKENLDFSNREYYAEAERVYTSCIYLEIHEGKWSYIDKVEDSCEPAFVKAIDLEDDNSEANDVEQNEVESLRSEVEHLKVLINDLQEIVVDLKSIAIKGGK